MTRRMMTTRATTTSQSLKRHCVPNAILPKVLFSNYPDVSDSIRQMRCVLSEQAFLASLTEQYALLAAEDGHTTAAR